MFVKVPRLLDNLAAATLFLLSWCMVRVLIGKGQAVISTLLAFILEA